MTASTVAQYLAALPADRRAALSAVRKVINENRRTDMNGGPSNSIARLSNMSDLASASPSDWRTG